MNALLAFAVWLHRPAGGSIAGDTAAMDFFVLATLGFLFFLLACFGAWAWLLWRRAQKPSPHVKLLMEVDEMERKPAETAPTEPPAPWERPADWWKN